jgi:putative DNA primase/helicase
MNLQPKPMLSEALAIAAKGVRVFPCDPHPVKPRAKRPLVPTDKGPDGKPIEGSGWPAKASTDPARIQAWWRKTPDALIGSCPAWQGGFVVDLDPKGETVEEVEARLVEAVGPLPAVARVRTPSGGLHLWFGHPGGEWGNERGGLKNIDIRADHGYVIVPPSTLRDGRGYAWQGAPFDPTTAPKPPARLLELIRSHRDGASRPAPTASPPPARPRPADRGEPATVRYSLRALDRISGDIARSPKGTRGTELFKGATQAGRFVAAGGLTEAQASAALRAAAEACGLVQDDGPASVARDIARGLAAGRADPAGVPQQLADVERDAERRSAGRSASIRSPAPAHSGSSGGSGRSGGRGEAVDDGELAAFPLTDLGNAERFAARNRGRLLHNPALGWLAWDGRRWSREDADAAVKKAAHSVARAIQGEADAIRGTEADIIIGERKGEPVTLSQAVASWGRATESATKLSAMPQLAAAYLTVRVDQLDADPWSLNVLNGTLRFHPGDTDRPRVELQPHEPADLITKLAPVVYDPNAEAPTYDRFLAEVQPRPEMRRFLHQWGGYSLTGDTGEQKLCFWFGKGRNGKSTLMDAWGRIAGDYGGGIPVESFMDQGRGRNAGAATPDLAILPGIRFLRTSEPEKGGKLAEALIKMVTGGEPMQARHLNRDYFAFVPSFKLTMAGNYRPKVSGTDEGIWRRIVLVPWLVTVTTPDRDLGSKLAAEASGILNRLLDGLRDYLDAGMVWPDAVTEATQAYREDSDPLGRFLAECTAPAPGKRVQSAALHGLHSAWCRSVGETPWSPKGLTSAMKDRGHTLIRSNQSWWVDLATTRTESDFAPEDVPAPPDYGDDR